MTFDTDDLPMRPPVLEYLSPSRTAPAPPLRAGVWAVVAGAVIGFFSLALGKDTVGPAALLIAAFFGGIWWLALRSPEGAKRGIWIRLQLIAAALALSMGTLAIFARSGEARAGPSGLAYWTTINRGFRYNPLYALRPWPFVAAALGWLIALLSFARINA